MAELIPIIMQPRFFENNLHHFQTEIKWKHHHNMGPKLIHHRPMVTWIIAVQSRSRPHSPDYRCSIRIPPTSPGSMSPCLTFPSSTSPPSKSLSSTSTSAFRSPSSTSTSRHVNSSEGDTFWGSPTIHPCRHAAMPSGSVARLPTNFHLQCWEGEASSGSSSERFYQP